MTHLCQNHAEYWKTLRRTNVFGEPYTIGFSWFQTFPTSRRLRWPVGKADKVFPWVCTRKELMRGELTEERTNSLACSTLERAILWNYNVRAIDPAMMPNNRQGWDRYGMEIKGEMK